MSSGTRFVAPCLALAVAFAGVACSAGLVARGARVEKLAGGFSFTEGPACDPQGNIYFTDPRYDEEDNLEQDGLHVYYLPFGISEPIRVIDDLERPNGIVGTPDGSRLYVVDEGADKTWTYRIQEDASLTEKRLFALQDSDGMTIDERGNLYLTHESVHIYSPEGEKITNIETPEAPTNVSFCGKDRKTLLITARQGLYAIKMNVKGY